MSLQTTIIQVILEIGITTISELARNVIYYILIMIIIKRIPIWIEQYHKNQMERYRIERAKEATKTFINKKD